MTVSSGREILKFARVIWLAGSIVVGVILATYRHPGPFRLACGLAILYLAPWGCALIQPDNRHRRNLIRFIACTVAIVLGFVFFEIPAFLGVLDYRIVFASPTHPWQRPGNRVDLDLLYVKKGHQRVRESFTGNETAWLRGIGPLTLYRSDRVYDRDGFRNPRDLDQADVIVVGDSFIEGAHVADKELVTSRLAAELGGQNPVINLGQAGYGPEQELRVLSRFGVSRHPSVCVWAFYEGNDLADIADYETSKILLEQGLRSAWGTGPGILERSFSSNALRFALRTWIDPEPRRASAAYRGWLQTRPGDRVPIYFASGDYRRPVVSNVDLERLREILHDASRICESEGIRLLIAFIPTKLRVYRNVCTFEAGSICARWPLDDLPTVLGKLVSEISTSPSYVDLTPTFQADAKRGALLYLPDDTHWSAEGHRLAARILSEVIRRGSRSNDTPRRSDRSLP